MAKTTKEKNTTTTEKGEKLGSIATNAKEVIELVKRMPDFRSCTK